MDGIIIVNKEKGYTSRDVVNIISKKLNTKKVGHAGTLDPIATGVLILGVNKGTKVLEYLSNDFKEYEAEVMLGIETDTLDIIGNIVNTGKVENISNAEIEAILTSFLGLSIQEVPKYSAIKIKGKKLYEYARGNKEIDLPKRQIEIKEIKLTKKLYKEDDYYCFKFKCLVSKGTYIRSLIRDIGIKLGTYATMKNLNRLSQGIFKIDEAINLTEINIDKIIPIKEALHNYSLIKVSKEEKIKVLNGCKLDKKIDDNIVILIDDQDEVIAIYQKEQDTIKPLKVLN
jgi:tRNA pseudouridine55 synthase